MNGTLLGRVLVWNGRHINSSISMNSTLLGLELYVSEKP